MKLRNKYTGNIRDFESLNLIVRAEEPEDGFESWNDYRSLAEFNEEWEDYKPAEPLIKDEKIRKAVRAWAEAECITKAYLENDYTICRDDDVDVSISFYVPVFKDVGGKSDYTIAELCGEEDE